MSAAPSPPNYRPADNASERCGTCHMFDADKGACWGFGNTPVEPDDVCDNWAAEPYSNSARGGSMEAQETRAPVPDEEREVQEEVRQEAVAPEVEYRRQRAEQMDGVREVRRFEASSLELRETSDGMLRFSGYASVTERAYEVGDFEEKISRGAFKRTLSEKPDVVLLINHGDGAGGLPLARTKSGTMTLTEDARGLRVDADLNPNDPDVRALIPKMERGDVDEMSFAFRVTDQQWSEDYTQRTIRGVALHKGDVSIVTYGANDASTGSIVRSSDGEFELRAGKAISAERMKALQGVLDRLATIDDNADAAQAELADVLGVQNPDTDDARSAETEVEERKVVPIRTHDLTARDRARLAVLKGGRR